VIYDILSKQAEGDLKDRSRVPKRQPTLRLAYDPSRETSTAESRCSPPKPSIEIVYLTAERRGPMHHRDAIHLQDGLPVTILDGVVLIRAGEDTRTADRVPDGDIVNLVQALAHAAAQLVITTGS